MFFYSKNWTLKYIVNIIDLNQLKPLSITINWTEDKISFHFFIDNITIAIELQ